MRAARLDELGGQPALGEADPPVRGPGQALVEITVAGVNPIDLAVGSGRFYGGSPTTPYTPGSEAVGRVLEADSLPVGSRVYISGDGLGRIRDGTFAERAVVSEEEAIPLPDGISDALAVGLGIAGLAGWLAVSWRAPVRSGDRVLVLGATGTVGLVALQGARLLGASRVVAAGRSKERLQRAVELGADAAVELGDGAGLPDAFRAAFDGEGPTLIVDPLWGAPLVAALEAAANGVRVVQVGQSAGPEAAIPSNFVRGKQTELLGYSNFAVPADVRRRTYLEMVAHATAGDLQIDLESYPLERVADAWQKQVQGPSAKIVVAL